MNTAMIDVDISDSTLRKAKCSTSFFIVKDDLVQPLYETSYVDDSISHGDLCLEYYKLGARAQIDVFILLQQDSNRESDVNDLVIALNWCIENNIQLISLSTGTILHSEAEKLYTIVKEIARNEIVLVASSSNERRLTYPACFDSCIGVGVDCTDTIERASFSYLRGSFDGVDVIISPYTSDGEYIGSNSEGTAYFAGTLFRRLKNQNHVREWLLQNSSPFNSRKKYHYLYNSIQSFSEEFLLIAVVNLSSSQVEEYSMVVQRHFNEWDYYCVSIFPEVIRTKGNDFKTYSHVFDSDLECSYPEFVQLISLLCCPSIAIVDYEQYDDKSKLDVILVDTKKAISVENAIIIEIAKNSPLEVVAQIELYFK